MMSRFSSQFAAACGCHLNSGAAAAGGEHSPWAHHAERDGCFGSVTVTLTSEVDLQSHIDVQIGRRLFCVATWKWHRESLSDALRTKASGDTHWNSRQRFPLNLALAANALLLLLNSDVGFDLH